MPAPAPLSLYGQVMYPPVVPAVPNIVTVVPLTVPAVPNIVTVVPPIVPTIPSLPIVFGVGVKRRHDEFDADSSSDNSNHRAPAKQAPKTPVHNVSASDSDDCSCSSSGSQTSDNVTTKKKVQKMPRITKEERTSVCDWIQKERSDGKMLNGRWIRNGGAKGATMTATSAEVKTSGAYDSLATSWLRMFCCFITSCLRRYVTRKLRNTKTVHWTKEVAKKRWTALLVASCVYCFVSSDIFAAGTSLTEMLRFLKAKETAWLVPPRSRSHRTQPPCW
jgi:hypothetical protein